MSKKLSFTKYESEVLPGYRKNINLAESSEDVKKFFVYAATKLLTMVYAEKFTFRYEDISLLLDGSPPYTLNSRLLENGEFTCIWFESDLPQLIDRLAVSAVNRCKRLEKHPEKQNSKIRM